MQEQTFSFKCTVSEVLIFHSKYMPDLQLMNIVVKYKKVVLFEWVMRIQPGTRWHCKVLAADRVIVINVQGRPSCFLILHKLVHYKKVLLDSEWCTSFLDI